MNCFPYKISNKVVSFAVLLIFAFVQNAFAFDSVPPENYEYQSSEEAFLDFDRGVFSPEYGDSAQIVRTPISAVLTTYRCAFGEHCAIEFLDGEGKALLTSDIRFEREFKRDLVIYEKTCVREKCMESNEDVDLLDTTWIEQRKQLLRSQLGDDIVNVKTIQLHGERKRNLMFEGLFFGLYGAFVLGGTVMLLELPISLISSSDYNWKVVGWTALGSFVGFFTLSTVSIAVNPYRREVDMVIRF